ncbi:hypothetical protein LXL04_002815 [Taraxacum kok-saghyz]
MYFKLVHASFSLPFHTSEAHRKTTSDLTPPPPTTHLPLIPSPNHLKFDFFPSRFHTATSLYSFGYKVMELDSKYLEIKELVAGVLSSIVFPTVDRVLSFGGSLSCTIDDVKKQTAFLLQSADVWSTSSSTEVCRCGPQTADVLPLKKQTTPKLESTQ